MAQLVRNKKLLMAGNIWTKWWSMESGGEGGDREAAAAWRGKKERKVGHDNRSQSNGYMCLFLCSITRLGTLTMNYISLSFLGYYQLLICIYSNDSISNFQTIPDLCWELAQLQDTYILQGIGWQLSCFTTVADSNYSLFYFYFSVVFLRSFMV